jgi:proton glutamate symport protein
MDTVIESPPANHIERKPRIGLAWQILIGLIIGIAVGLVLNHFPQMRDATVSGLLQPAGASA